MEKQIEQLAEFENTDTLTKVDMTPVKVKSHPKLQENGYLAGRWTKDEHKLFLEALKLYGKDWEAI